MLELHALRLDAEERREPRWKPIATLHRPSARWPSSSSACVTSPVGFVKSTNHAPGAPRRAVSSASSSTTGTVRSAFANPPGPVVSCPMQPNRSGMVSSWNRAGLAAHPELHDHEVGALERLVAVAGEREVPRPAGPAHHPLRERADDRQALGIDVQQHQLVHGNRSPRVTNPSTSSGVYVLPPPTTATFTPMPRASYTPTDEIVRKLS